MTPSILSASVFYSLVVSVTRAPPPALLTPSRADALSLVWALTPTLPRGRKPFSTRVDGNTLFQIAPGLLCTYPLPCLSCETLLCIHPSAFLTVCIDACRLGLISWPLDYSWWEEMAPRLLLSHLLKIRSALRLSPEPFSAGRSRDTFQLSTYLCLFLHSANSMCITLITRRILCEFFKRWLFRFCFVFQS